MKFLKTWWCKIKSSRTLIASTLIGMIGIIEVNLHLVKDAIGEDNYGFLVIGIGILMFWLRMITTTPVQEKQDK